MRLLWAALVLGGLWGCRDNASEPAVPDPAGLTVPRYGQYGADSTVVMGEVIYVPVYSRMHYLDRKHDLALTSTLAIHNTELESDISLAKVDYYNTHGTLIRHYLAAPVRLRPLQTASYVVEEKDTTGGIGANFIVEWTADNQVSTPLVEAVMISNASTSGTVSFVSAGKVIKMLGRATP